MKILFWGETEGNSGPENVNELIAENLTDSFVCVRERNPVRKMLKGIRYCLESDVTVISGVSRKGCLLALLAKRVVYILHGCAAREAEADGLEVPAAIRQERYLMKKADLLLCVSENFRDWVRDVYPQYAGKTDFLHPGVECRRVTGQKIPGSVIAAGGDSAIKNNAVLAEAVEGLGGRAKLEVYGSLRGQPASRTHTRWMGGVSHGEFLQRLARAEIFVLNSRFETFSLAVIEALGCGCSVLVSEKAGVTEVLAPEETDILRDPLDTEEIRRKISCLLEKPNNGRLLQSLDWEEISAEGYVRRLEEKCALLMRREKRE